MLNSQRDQMWEEFTPLWTELLTLNALLLICGGYGLYLKQRWLLNPEQRQAPIIVGLDRWRDVVPRTTKDVDLIVGIEIIADAGNSKNCAQILTNHGFKATKQNPRWQFEKMLPKEQHILVELHCSPPPSALANVSTDRTRIKHSPSLKGAGIHGKTNPEAVGSDLHPFSFAIENLSFRVPNSLTWCVMKLTAMDDRWQRAMDLGRDQSNRAFSREQAMKHAQDVCRIIALTTRDESDNLDEVKAALESTPEFVKACRIVATLNDNSLILATVKQQWSEEDFNTIRLLLSRWFQES